MYASTNNSGVVSVFSLGDDGLPIYVESFDVGTIYLRELALSSDNSTLYVGAMGSGNLYICAIDAATGELSSAGTLAMGGAGQTAHFAIGGDGEKHIHRRFTWAAPDCRSPSPCPWWNWITTGTTT